MNKEANRGWSKAAKEYRKRIAELIDQQRMKYSKAVQEQRERAEKSEQELIVKIKRIAALEAAHKANLHQQVHSVKYEDKGHRCSWRVVYEAAMQRSKAVLKEQGE